MKRFATALVLLLLTLTLSIGAQLIFSKKILHILLVHRSMDEIEININSLGEYLGAGDRESLRQACTEALMQLENLRDAGRITIENILKIA